MSRTDTILAVALSLGVMPYMASAAMPTTLSELIDVFLGIIQLLIVLVFALTMIIFFWNIVRSWILHIDKGEASINVGKQTLLWGIIALIVMSGLWALVALVRQTISF